MMKRAISTLNDFLNGTAALALATSRLPLVLTRDYWASSVLESATGHHLVGVADGLFGRGTSTLERGARQGMTVRVGRRPVGLDERSLAAAFPRATGRVVVFLHGLVETELGWFRGSAPEGDFGARLAGDFGSSPVYVRYNSGRHVSESGAELVALLSRLVAAWPVPVADIVLIGHSMGGLVARSALYQAQERNVSWLSVVTRLVCLGTPHSGAPLERRVAQLTALFGKTTLTAPLTKLFALRSNGIQDLAHGYVHRRQWATEPHLSSRADPSPSPGIRRLFVSATLSRREGSTWGRLIGDLLVTPVLSEELTEDAEIVWLGGLNHFALLRDDLVYTTLLEWLCADDTVQTFARRATTRDPSRALDRPEPTTEKNRES
ncbi:alpha/beta fold hydrolase [Amycolatopsis sp. BJA-103]|uniref:alpha/beta fold hydrolase n=1 Tax=Amycolatopsis sp. BJA-103 TaxID=1911175 RepID=UPI001304A96C|nr:alpha/beta fold hydrolase [Amycolatopsis sp. BJA-103]